MIKRFLARKNKVPYQFKKLWVAGRLYCREELTTVPGFELLFVNRDSGSNGAIVPLLKRNEIIYFYKVTDAFCAPGSDHIISPWSFNFTYHHKEPQS